MKDLQKTRFSDNNRDEIIHWLEAGGESNEEGLILTEKQIQLLARWRFVDEKFRENKYKTEQIALFVMGKYEVSRDTAYRDIVNAQYVLSSTCPLSKRYLIQQRIEFLILKIKDAYVDQDRFNAANLEKQLREYIKMYPEVSPVRTPKTIIYNIQNNLLVTTITPEQALIDADEVIKKMEEGQHDW